MNESFTQRNLQKVSRVMLVVVGCAIALLGINKLAVAQEEIAAPRSPYDNPRYEAFNLAHELVLKKVIEERFSDQEKRVLVFHHFDEGTKFYRARKFDLAIVEFQKALEIDPTYEMAREHLRIAEEAYNRRLRIERDTKVAEYIRHAKRYIHNCIYEKAIEELEVALEIFPESPEANRLMMQAQRLFENQLLRDLAQAMTTVVRTEYNKDIDNQYRFAVRADSQTLNAQIERNKLENLLNEGKEYFMQKKYGKAIETWESILKQNPRPEDRQIVNELIDIARRAQMKRDKEWLTKKPLHGWCTSIP